MHADMGQILVCAADASHREPQANLTANTCIHQVADMTRAESSGDMARALSRYEASRGVIFTVNEILCQPPGSVVLAVDVLATADAFSVCAMPSVTLAPQHATAAAAI